MRSFLRFPFTQPDLDRIDAATVTVADEPYSRAPVRDQPYPQALKLAFRVTDPQNGAPQVRPLFPGTMRFIADADAPGSYPTPESVELTEAAYVTWKTVGTLMVTTSDQATVRELAALSLPPGGSLEVAANVIWYSPVKVTSSFLFTALVAGLKQATIPGVGGSPTIRPGDPAWSRYAIAHFLAGAYTPELRLKADAGTDEVVAQPMPAVEMAADGTVELVVQAACRRDATDGPNVTFDELAGFGLTQEPAHPANGAIPARHVFRSLQAHLVDAATAHPVKAAVLAEWPETPRYFALRFTRAWEPVEECSVHLPAQQVRVEDARAPGFVLCDQRLPAHGVLWLAQHPGAGAPVPPWIRLSATGGMRWLDGATPDAWRVKAAEAPLTFDLAAVPAPHILMRRRMTHELLADPERPAPGGSRCTYLSMRRSVRALVDHRVAGGRLVRQGGSTVRTTLSLMDHAWAGTPAVSRLLADNRPLPSDPPEKALDLEPVLRAFFPDDVPAKMVDGALEPRVPMDGGQMAYALWQTAWVPFQSDQSERNFSTEEIGHGGPGALVGVGLAAGYHVDPKRLTDQNGNLIETDAAYFERLVDGLLTGLEPGAALQFWVDRDDLDIIKERRVVEEGPGDLNLARFGHSPLFLRYLTDTDGTVTGIRVLDQNPNRAEGDIGERDCEVYTQAQPDGTSGRQLSYGLSRVEFWVAANWEE